jgi:hypothetical protein
LLFFLLQFQLGQVLGLDHGKVRPNKGNETGDEEHQLKFLALGDLVPFPDLGQEVKGVNVFGGTRSYIG